MDGLGDRAYGWCDDSAAMAGEPVEEPTRLPVGMDVADVSDKSSHYGLGEAVNAEDLQPGETSRSRATSTARQPQALLQHKPRPVTGDRSRFLSQARVESQSKGRIWWLSGQGPVKNGSRRRPSYLVAPQRLCYLAPYVSRYDHATTTIGPSSWYPEAVGSEMARRKSFVGVGVACGAVVLDSRHPGALPTSLSDPESQETPSDGQARHRTASSSGRAG